MTEQRNAFEVWISQEPRGYSTVMVSDKSAYSYNTVQVAWESWKEALQSQTTNTGWKEAAIAWEVCASIHRQYCKGKDPLFTTRQDDFVKHAADARAHALQSQDREGAFCVWHNDPETDKSWDTSCRKLFEIYDGTPTENGMTFCCYCGKPIREAIDHARRLSGETT